MARQEKTIKAWAKDGSEHHMHTPDNARDLVMHAGWHYSDPKIAAVETIKKAQEVLDDSEDTPSFDDKKEVKAEEKVVKVEEKTEEKPKAAAKPSKPSRK